MTLVAPGLRWTIGNVSRRGFEALRLSVWGAHRLFGDAAAYAICCNGVPLDGARARAAPLPVGVAWHAVDHAMLPHWLLPHLEAGIAEGVAWKFAPLRLFPDRHEIALDNDCILWAVPEAMQSWLAGDAPGRCLLAADVKPAFGQFADLCGPEPRNSGIRGVPPGHDFAAALRQVLEVKSSALGRPVVLTSELDEQGLQTAALSRQGALLAVAVEEVTICSPFWPHRPDLGACGAHFVGLNSRHIAWDYYGRPADDWMREHWARHLPTLRERTGAPPPGE
jgi:hypothetical protein